MPTWFSAVTQARHTEGGRSVRLKGGVRMDESILAAEPSIRYAYRVDETNAPGLRALLEEWRLTTTESGTRVQWTFAADGPAPCSPGCGWAGPEWGGPSARPCRSWTNGSPRPPRSTAPDPNPPVVAPRSGNPGHSVQSPVARNRSITSVQGAMSIPCTASQLSE